MFTFVIKKISTDALEWKCGVNQSGWRGTWLTGGDPVTIHAAITEVSDLNRDPWPEDRHV
jgi:hypothetical protein